MPAFYFEKVGKAKTDYITTKWLAFVILKEAVIICDTNWLLIFNMHDANPG